MNASNLKSPATYRVGAASSLGPEVVAGQVHSCLRSTSDGVAGAPQCLQPVPLRGGHLENCFIILYAGMPMRLPARIAVEESIATTFTKESDAWYAAFEAGFSPNLVQVVPVETTNNQQPTSKEGGNHEADQIQP